MLKPGIAAGAPLITRRIPASAAGPGSVENLPVIGLGTWQTFDVAGTTEARAPLREVLQAFAGAGARLVDSSPMYGASESVTGDLAESLGLLQEPRRLFMATKVWTRGRDEGIAQMEQSMARLRVPAVDLMQVHNLVDLAVHSRTLRDWQARGRVRYVGLTHYTASAHAEVERALEAGKYDFLQINYSLAERESERRLLPLALEKGMAVIINRPFAEGALFSRTRGKSLPAWASELGIQTWAQFFLKWIVSHPSVTCAIPATSKAAHMLDNLGAGRGVMPDAAMRIRMAQHMDAI